MSTDEQPSVDEVSLHEVVLRSAKSGLDIQRSDGSFPPGKSYDDPLTPVRSTSNWLILLLKAYELTGKSKFCDAAYEATDYLLQDRHRPSGHSFYARTSDGKDKCNGLVGQAHPIKALTRAGNVLDVSAATETAFDVFTAHPFNENLGLWERIEVDGTPLSYDRTLNHQITFAAAGSLIENNDHVQEKINTFLYRLAENTGTRSTGLIRHFVHPPLSRVVRHGIRNIKNANLLWNDFMYHRYSLSSTHEKKEAGYHPVNLMGLSKLIAVSPDHKCWSSSIISSIFDFINSEYYKGFFEQSLSPYGNIPQGYGNALAHVHFYKDLDLAREWLGYEIYHRYDFCSGMMGKNTVHPPMQTASLANIVDLPDMDLPLESDIPI